MDLLACSDLDSDQYAMLVQRAIALSHHWSERSMPQTLAGARVGLIAELPGWRNPNALALGIQSMGGVCVDVTAKLEGAEPLSDLAAYMDNWFDLMAVRTPHLKTLHRFADALNAPIMNLRTHDNHPCEVLGDLAYIASQRGRLDGLSVACVGPHGNIARSWAEAASVLPLDVIQIAPKPFALQAGQIGFELECTDDLNTVRKADVIVTDCWPEHMSDHDRGAFAELRIDAHLLNSCRPDVMFIPCPPVTRGQEVSDDAMRHPRCVATQAKGFLLHAQNAFVEMALAGR